MLSEYVSKAGINSPRRPTADSSVGMNVVTTYLGEILSILVHSYLLQSASSKCPLERIEQSVGGKRQSTSEMSVMKKYSGGHQREEERIQEHVEDRHVTNTLGSYQACNLSESATNHGNIVGMDCLSGFPLMQSEWKNSPGGGPCFSSFPFSAPDHKILIDSTNQHATFSTGIANMPNNFCMNIGSPKNVIRTDHLLYGNEDPRTISLQSSTDFIRHLKSRRKVHDGS